MAHSADSYDLLKSEIIMWRHSIYLECGTGGHYSLVQELQSTLGTTFSVCSRQQPEHVEAQVVKEKWMEKNLEVFISNLAGLYYLSIP